MWRTGSTEPLYPPPHTPPHLSKHPEPGGIAQHFPNNPTHAKHHNHMLSVKTRNWPIFEIRISRIPEVQLAPLPMTRKFDENACVRACVRPCAGSLPVQHIPTFLCVFSAALGSGWSLRVGPHPGRTASRTFLKSVNKLALVHSETDKYVYPISPLLHNDFFLSFFSFPQTHH